MEILSREIDLAGKTRIVFQFSDRQAEMLKFENEVSDEEAIATMQEILDRRANQVIEEI